MPVNTYETLFLLDSNKLAAEPDAVKGALHAAVERHGGRVEVGRPWDDPDGVRRYATTIIVNRIQPLDWRRRSDQAEQ